jgi:hypothetical protein
MSADPTKRSLLFSAREFCVRTSLNKSINSVTATQHEVAEQAVKKMKASQSYLCTVSSDILTRNGYIYKEMCIFKNLVFSMMEEAREEGHFSEWMPANTPQVLEEIIMKRWTDLYSDLHGVAYCVHPAWIDACHAQEKNAELMRSMLVLPNKLLKREQQRGSSGVRSS